MSETRRTDKRARLGWPALLAGVAISVMAAFVSAQAPPVSPTPTPNLDDPSVPRHARIAQHQELIRNQLELLRKRRLERNGVVPPPPGSQATPLPGGLIPGYGTIPEGVWVTNTQNPQIIRPAPKPTPAPVAAPPVGSLEARAYLAIEPATLHTSVGELFDTHITVRNERYSPFDELELRVSYPPHALELVAVSDASVRPRLEGEPLYENQSTSGVLYYCARLAIPHHFRDESILHLRWRARTPGDLARIGFSFGDGKGARTTGLRLRGADRLGSDEEDDDGALFASVLIEAKGERSGRPIVGDYWAGTDSGIRLRMASESADVAVGEQLTVGVFIENPENQFLDSVRVRIGFVPEIMKVVDWDRGNGIRLGVNAQDGFARERYPFSFHRRNIADNTRGVIDYEMGMANRFIPPSGELLRIKFEALKEIDDNAIWFDINPTEAGPATALFSEGRNVSDYTTFLSELTLFLDLPIAPAPEQPTGEEVEPDAATPTASL